jgi:hypothetical protein
MYCQQGCVNECVLHVLCVPSPLPSPPLLYSLPPPTCCTVASILSATCALVSRACSLSSFSVPRSSVLSRCTCMMHHMAWHDHIT